MEKLKKKFDQLIISISMLLMALPMQVHASAASTSDNFMAKFNAFLDEYSVFINAFMGFMLLTTMVNFIYNVVALNKNADNPQKKMESIHNLLEAGIGLAIQGSISLFIMIYFYIFR